MFLMGFSTMAVGILPTYQQVGLLAPVLLVIVRLVQGFAVAGEISGASSMILEHAPFGRRGFYASFTLQGVQAGQILAAAVFLPLAAYMPAEAFNSWGWRIPFLLSFFVIIAGYIIRSKVEETPAFAKEEKQGKVPRAPIIQAFELNWRDMLRVVCMARPTRSNQPTASALKKTSTSGFPSWGICWPCSSFPSLVTCRTRSAASLLSS
jgi:MFS family permease